jgi:hypothetical protein
MFGGSGGGAFPVAAVVAAPLFQGNPNQTISAINVSGGITLSRTSGSIPAFVHVSANGITATGTSWPYEDLEYQWDFGDPSGTEVFTNPVTGNSDNANTAQWGPEAAYCYRSVGTGSYIITLKIRGKNGGTYTTTTQTATFTVSAFTATTDLYFDSVSGSDSNSGTSAGSPKQTISAMITAVNAITSNTRINLKCGSSWTGADFNFSFRAYSGLRFTSYSTGAKPIVIGNTATTSPNILYFDNGAVTTDVVMSNISFQASSGYTKGNILQLAATGGASNALQNIYLDNCDFIYNFDPPSTCNVVICEAGTGSLAINDSLSKVGFWGGSITNPTNTVNVRMGIFSAFQQFFFMCGVSISGAGSSDTFDHHIYPSIRLHTTYRWINFGSGPNRGFCINTNWDTVSGSSETAQYICISDCNVTGTSYAIDMSSGSPAFDPANAIWQNAVVQRCTIHDITIGGEIMGQMGNAFSMTIRDCKVWNNTGSGFFWMNGNLNAARWNTLAAMAFKYYRNREYYPSTSSASIPTHEFCPTGTSLTTLQQFTDNIIQDMRASARFVDISFSGQAGAPIDRNQYYFPNSGTSVFKDSPNGSPDGGTAKTFAQWQAAGFDTNGTVANPNWPSPSTGNFG